MNRETFTTLHIVGKTPAENEMLNISANWVEISTSSFNIRVGMLLVPTDSFEFREDTIFYISDLFVGLRKKEF